MKLEISHFGKYKGSDRRIIVKQRSIRKVLIPAVLICAIILSACGGKKTGSDVNDDDPAKMVPVNGDDGIDVSGVKTKAYDSVFVAGDAGYEYYHFNKDIASKYAAAVKRAGETMKGSADVYDMVIPTAMDVILPDAIRKEVKNTNDQREAVKFIYDAIGSGVKCVDIFDTLRQHKKDYLYFRTDHHWTALGAYYAYRELCKAKGITNNKRGDMEMVTFDGFLGSFYSSSKDENLKGNPDTVEAYVASGTNDMKFTDKDGKETAWKIIKDVTSWAAGSKYNTFIGGDNPWSVIDNPKVKDGSAALVVKESFGNAMIPFLVDHYQHLYIVDYRYYTGTLSELKSKYRFGDVIFLSAISAGMGSNNVSRLENFVK